MYRMADTEQDWRDTRPTSMYAVIVARRCGWHVFLHRHQGGVAASLKATTIGKSCIPYRPNADTETAYGQAEALSIGILNITHALREECSSL